MPPVVEEIPMPAAPLTLERALELFDRLEPVAPEEVLGRWRGEGFPTGHPLDGLLEAWHWHGKRFDSPEEVHPLVFRAVGGGLITVDPSRVPVALLRASWVGALKPYGGLFPWLAPLVSTPPLRCPAAFHPPSGQGVGRHALRPPAHRGCVSSSGSGTAPGGDGLQGDGATVLLRAAAGGGIALTAATPPPS